MVSTQKKVIIIGSGIGGLSSAALLAKEGFDVTVIEKNEQAGGRGRVWKEKGFTFDMGPSWYMMPDVFERFFGYFGKQTSNYYKLNRLDPMYRVVFEDTTYDISPDLAENMKIFESIEKGAGEKFEQYIADAKFKYEIAMREFIYNPYASFFDFFNKTMLVQGVRLKVFSNYHKQVTKYFKNKRLQRLVEWMTGFTGSSPFNTPAVYSLINYADFGLGQWYPMGGLGKVFSSMQSLAKEQGVQFIFNEEVVSIQTQNGSAHTVVTTNNEYCTDYVIANADYAFVENNLLTKSDQSFTPGFWDKQVYSPSCLLFYIGLNKKVSDKILHHTICLESDWLEYNDSLFKNPSWPKDFIYYVCCPSKTDPEVAPAGCENLFFVLPVASGIEDSPEIRDQYYDKIMTKFETYLGEDIRSHVIVKRDYSVDDFTADYHAHKGNAFGMAHTLLQTAIFRPKNRSKKVQNLFYAGGSTNPGVGLPTCLISGEIAAQELIKFVRTKQL